MAPAPSSSSTTPPPADDNKWFIGALSLLVAVVIVPVMVIGGIAAARSSGGDGGSGSGSQAEANITLAEFSIKGDLTVPSGPVVFHVKNAGTMVHNFTINGLDLTTGDIPAGGTADLTVPDLPAGEYTVVCTIAGHEAAGMKASLVVSSSGGGGETASGGSSSASSGSSGSSGGVTSGHDLNNATPAEYATFDRDMVESFKPFPAKTKGVGNQLLEPKVAADGVKEYTLTGEISDWEVTPGKVVKAWTFNGMVPGPMIHVNVGDTVRIKYVNKLPVSSDIHWHGIEVPADMDGVAPLTQDPVKPDTTFTYKFTVDHPYVAMYHPHLHGQTALPNGMFGAFLVGEMPLPTGQTISGIQIPNDLTISQEIPMVLNDAGTIGLSLNGKGFPATAPLQTTTGDWVEIHYYNEGLQVHPMHMHQFPQLVIAKDGIPLDHPYYADTILVGPGERYTVIVNTNKAGVWVWHCHILNHAENESGMFGMVTAVITKDPGT